MNSIDKLISAVTINFHDPNDATENGEYHLLEIRLENEGNSCRFFTSLIFFM